MFTTLSKKLKEHLAPSLTAHGSDEKGTDTEDVTQGTEADTAGDSAATPAPDDKITVIATNESAKEYPSEPCSVSPLDSARDDQSEGDANGEHNGGGDAAEEDAAIPASDDKITATESNESVQDTPNKPRSEPHLDLARDDQSGSGGADGKHKGDREGGHEGKGEQEEGDVGDKSPDGEESSPEDVSSVGGVARQPRRTRGASARPASGDDQPRSKGVGREVKGGKDDGDSDSKILNNGQASREDVISAVGIVRRKSPRISEDTSAKSENVVDPVKSQVLARISAVASSSAAASDMKRKSPRLRENNIVKLGAVAVASRSSAKKSPTGKRNAAEPSSSSVKKSATAKRKAVEPSSSPVKKSGTAKRKAAELEQEKEEYVSKKQKLDIATQLRDGWTRGSFTYKKESKARRTWISPVQKLEFKYGKDALTFDALCKSNGGDEIEAWKGYTTIKQEEKAPREVRDLERHDKEMGLDADLFRRQNKPEILIGPGWDVDWDRKTSKKKSRWISPVRKMRFRYKIDAQLFESMRQEHGEDEIQAWIEYTKLKHRERKNREVQDANAYDEGIMDVSAVRLSVGNDGKGIGPGWNYEKKVRKTKILGLWISPTRKMAFMNRKDAEIFETLRQKHGTDEIQAWVEYTKFKTSKNERREVVACNQYDLIDGASVGRWSEDEYKRWLQGLLKFGKNYKKIKDYLGSRTYSQIKTFGTRYFRTGGVIPKSEEEIDKMTEKAEEERKRNAAKDREYSFHTDSSVGCWTKDEHKKFLQGVLIFGKNFKKIAELFDTRTYYQVAHYGAKYFYSVGKIPTSREEIDKMMAESQDEFKCHTGKRSDLSTNYGSWTKDEEKKWLHCLLKFGKDYVKIEKSIETRTYKQVKDHAKKHFQSGGKIPKSEEEIEKILESYQKDKGGKSAPKYKSEPSIKSAPNKKDIEKMMVEAESKHQSKHNPTSSQNSVLKRKAEPISKSVPKHKTKLSRKSAPPKKRAHEPSKNNKRASTSTERTSVEKPSRKPTRIQPKRGQTITETAINAENATSNQSDDDDVVASAEVLYDECKASYIKEFGGEMAAGEVNINMSWKEIFDNIIGLKKGFTSEITPTIMETSVGVLRWEKEEAALFEDNPQIAPVDREISKGYTDLQALNCLPTPPNCGNLWEPPFLLYGDFDGIKLYDSSADFLCGKRRAYISMGDEHGQVTTVVVCKFNEVSESTANAPCCFIGYESGCVAALTATLCDEGRSYNFFVERPRHVHNSKVSALTIMNCTSTSDSRGLHSAAVLLSACYDGQVFYYPNSLDPDSNFDLTHVRAFSNSQHDLCPILTMASTTFVENNKEFSLVCTGDREGSVRLWLASDGLLEGKSSDGDLFSQVKWYKSKGRHCVTIVKFVNSQMLVSGNNQGDIRVWNLVTMEETDGNSLFPGLSLCHFFKHAHNGPVETVMNLGDIIITSGGNDGNLIGWDVASGKQLGIISCHYGQETFDEATGAKGLVKSCVVGAQVVDKKLITLCRDGVLADWKFS